MSLLHWILNLAALFFWIDWRTGRAVNQPRPLISLASALRETHRNRGRGWGSLAAFFAIVALRPFVYETIGAAINWTPVVDVLGLSLSWRSDLLDRIFVYSTGSIALTLGYYYGCLLFISAMNPPAMESDEIHRFIRAQLGWLAKIPSVLKLLLPFAACALAWVAAVPLMVTLGIMPAVPEKSVLWTQAGILALASVAAWKWFFFVFLLLYALNSYVYLGTHPFWTFIQAAGGKLLRVGAFLRAGKLDLAPFAAIVLLFGLADWVIRPAVAQMFDRTLK